MALMQKGFKREILLSFNQINPSVMKPTVLLEKTLASIGQS